MGWLQFKPYVLRVWCTEREDIWEGCPGHPEKTSHRDKNRLSNYALNSIPSPILVAWSALVHCTRSCILHTYPWELHLVHAEENDTLYPVSSNILSFVSVVLLASSVQLLLCEVPFLQIIDFPENQTGESFLCPPSHAQQSVIGMMTMPSPAAQSFPLCAHKKSPPAERGQRRVTWPPAVAGSPKDDPLRLGRTRAAN